MTYDKLKSVFEAAFQQASIGKGAERHAELDENFEDQIICEVNRRLGGDGAGCLFQAVKKIYESRRLTKEHAIHELYGALNYIAAAIILMEEKE